MLWIRLTKFPMCAARCVFFFAPFSKRRLLTGAKAFEPSLGSLWEPKATPYLMLAHL